MSEKVLCKPTELYNILNQHNRISRLAESNYLCLIDARAEGPYYCSHVITARNAKWDVNGKCILPPDLEIESMRYIIVYDSNTSSFLDSGPAIDCANSLAKASRYPVQILIGGYERFSAIYPFFRTQKITYTIRELENMKPYPVEILPGQLYMGNYRHATNPRILKDLKLTALISISEDSSLMFEKGSCAILYIPVADSVGADLYSSFEQASIFLASRLNTGSAALICSTHGISRCSTLAMAFLIHHLKYTLKETHRLYKQKLDEVSKLQHNCLASIARQKKRLKDLSDSLEECKQKGVPEDINTINGIQESMKERPNIFFEMEAFLPKKNGLYLSLVLGNVNVTLLNKQFAYKDEYEKFKLCLTVILLFFSFTCRYLVSYRVVDALLNFLLVWYYCTLTIRESILINNGSKIKGWWVFQHYVSTFLSGVMLTWPEGELYQMFRNQFLSYSMYINFVQFLQYYYQSGCLYRLRALGERHNMDLTVEGFQSWMCRGLTFLLPFLFFGHFWQLYNGITLFQMAQLPEWKEWQVLMCGSTFLVLFMGNFFTTLGVVYHKYTNQDKAKDL
ncbi:hypothetical protein P4O66_005592 [Electrophorus voltai]|uniref:Tyrosine-protein phosphatase domain-containing protein n=1 Tax=Electrophorus voltai TaxID=2609070 RepID=A0AAD8ZJ33_9TELE|nr:hypothetical protein P4O66_005592 [Electrophorus voltai]